MASLQTKPSRAYATTQQYAAAVRAVAAQLDAPLLDVWSLFVAQEDWQTALLSPDGLHLAPGGQELVAHALMGLLGQQLPAARPVALPWHHPTWWFIDYKRAEQQWAAERDAYEAAYGRL